MAAHREYFDQLALVWDEVSGTDIERIVQIISHAQIEPGNKVLDIGTGTGILLPFLNQMVGHKGKIYALDLSENMIKRAQEKFSFPTVNFIHASVEDIPLEDTSIDCAICFSAFPHFQDQCFAISQVHRVLKPGGRFLIGHSEGRDTVNERHRRIGGVVQFDMLPSSNEMQTLLEEAGFSIVVSIDNPDEYVLVCQRQ